MSKTKKTSSVRHYIKSSSFVMALLFTLLCGTTAVGLGYFINYFAKGHFIHNTEEVINSEIKYIQTIEDISTLKSSDSRLYIRLDEQGNLPKNYSKDISVLTEGIIKLNHDDKAYAGKIHSFENDIKILVAYDITAISKDFQVMQWIGIASITFITLVVFISYIISIFVVSGTNKIARTAQNIIATGDLSKRVDVGFHWDDLGHMADVLNDFLDRIQNLMKGVRNVSDNIAHDLRTPLTRMRNKIEALQKDEPHNQSYNDLIDEADHLLNTFNALLRISRIESEKQKKQFQDVDLSQLLNDVIEFYEPLAEEQNISLTSSLDTASIYGDRDLLFQIFANLFDNSIKFTPTNGTIHAEIKKHKKQIYISVSDTGIGIPTVEHEKIFNRFYRGDESRSSQGIGLGLSLVKAVIDLHGGSIKVENNNPGLKIITVF